jgi:3-hydroxyisobutyrate dehydrogenase-like beta-hydroxyacid dehydrogenase
MSSIKAGFIGLGSMGMPMARSIASSGLPLTVYDLRKEPLEEMRALGARVAGSSREVAATSDAVISMVRDVPETEEVIFGKGGVWEGMKKGGTIIISSTIGPASGSSISRIPNAFRPNPVCPSSALRSVLA